MGKSEMVTNSLAATIARSQGQPRLVISMGDPAGIGPEVVLKALADPQVRSRCEVTLVGDRALLQGQYDRLRAVATDPIANPADWPVIDVPVADGEGIVWGVERAAAGAASFAWLDRAIAATLAGQFDAIVTAPIAKSAWHAAGHPYPGQTEVLAERAGCDRFGMMFAAQSPQTGWTLRALLATTHIPLAAVPRALTPELLDRKLALAINALDRDFGVQNPHIAIAGLNPHSGEGGQLGTDEQDWMQAWLDRSRDRYGHCRLTGLVPPDTLWVAGGRGWFGTGPTDGLPDAYLAMYHDQGLIPVKLMAFDRAVNITVGLPFARTSPDHGTAFDIAGRGIASPTSTIAAIDRAIDLVGHRRRHHCATPTIARV